MNPGHPALVNGGGVFVPAAGVLFDCDGVLVDSDASVVASWTRWAADYDLDPAAVLEVVPGYRAADTIAAFIPPPLRAEALERITVYEVDDAEGVRGVPGAAELLDAMPAGTWAVVTSGNRRVASARLRAARLPAAPVLITADDVTTGKPSPEPFLAGAASLGIDPDAAVVVEDSAKGIAAARAARSRVIGVGRPAMASAPDFTVTDLTGATWEGDGLRLAHSSLLA